MLIVHEVMGRHCGWLTAATAREYLKRQDTLAYVPGLGLAGFALANGPAAVATLNPFEQVEAETIAFSSGLKTEDCDDTGGGLNVTQISAGDYINFMNKAGYEGVVGFNLDGSHLEWQNVSVVEKSREYKGVYHVLMGALSPLHGVGPDDLKIKDLLTRVATGSVEEVVLATNPNVEGEATAIYLARQGPDGGCPPDVRRARRDG